MTLLDQIIDGPPRRKRRSITLLSIFILALFFDQVLCFTEVRCPKLDIRNSPRRVYHGEEGVTDPAMLKNCTIIEGSLSITRIGSNTRTDEFILFENLREITGYLVIFQVRALRTLRQIFPKLRVIGGNELVNKYSLEISWNHDLIEVNLPSLTTIRNGGVRITENANVCFVDTINNLYTEDCRSMFAATTICPFFRTQNESGPGPGCSDEDGSQCHPQCIGGCSRANDPAACHSCLHVAHENKCIAACPPGLLTFLKRRCVTEVDCRSISDRHKAIHGKCVHKCPDGYEEDLKNPHFCQKCKGSCPRRCGGKYVDSMDQAMSLKDCAIITGNLEIKLKRENSEEYWQLIEAFGKIEVIEGYLIVRFSPDIITLQMFESLHRIVGKELFRNKYSLIVFDNQGLRQLFNPGQNITIENGKLLIQNNRVLCFKRIHGLLKSVGKESEMDSDDQSPDTNGNKAMCW